ncbi:MAG: hypothetical protein ACO1N3_02755 [Gammaproteobacteria bacterium]
MKIKLSERTFGSGFTGAKIATFGFFTGNVLGVSAVKSIGSWGIAASAGFTGAALFFLPAIILRTMAKQILHLNRNSMFAFDLALTFASAAIGAYCFGIAMTSMLTCAALGVGISLLLDYVGDEINNHLERRKSAGNRDARQLVELDVAYSVGQFRM